MGNDFGDIGITIVSVEDLEGAPTNLEDLLGDIVQDDTIEDVEGISPAEIFGPTDPLVDVDMEEDEEYTDAEEEELLSLYEHNPITYPTLKESIKNIRTMMKRVL